MKLLAVFLLVFSVMAQTSGDPIPDDGSVDEEQVDLLQRSDSCSDGWTPVNGRCFQYIPKPMTWARAERNCLSMGANLASVQNMNEYRQIQSVISSATYGSKPTWIGGTDAQENGIWFWSDGSPFKFRNWCPGEPNNGGGNQNCLQINYSGFSRRETGPPRGQQRQAQATPGSHDAEAPGGCSDVPTGPASNPRRWSRSGHRPEAKSDLVKRSTFCSRGWTGFNGRCFRYIPKPMSWARAEKNCESMKANLASVHNIEDYHEIQSLIMTASHEYKETWIGGTDAQEENQWFWSDGTPFHYINWCPGEPNNHKRQQHCLRINHGGVNQCHIVVVMKILAVCVLVTVAVAQSKAAEKLSVHGANLASVQNMNEYRQIQSVISSATYGSKPTWIGGTDAQEVSLAEETGPPQRAAEAGPGDPRQPPMQKPQGAASDLPTGPRQQPATLEQIRPSPRGRNPPPPR
ncbi:C-type mannose receptor 2-like [Anableps anableps]